MSYCRWTSESDVYVYESSGGFFTCCLCSLRTDGRDLNTKKRSQMIAHLKEHRKAGHEVPQWATDRLIEEIKIEGDNWKE